MNLEIIKIAAKELNISFKQIQAVLDLLANDNTVPFIARYRKEATGGLDEDQIRNISKYYDYQINLLTRKEDILRLIAEKGMLTKELKQDIQAATKLNQLEDLYRPYKEKKKTRATEAKARGLEPLAKLLVLNRDLDLEKEAHKYLNDDVLSTDAAIQGALDIIAEDISDNLRYRKFVKDIILKGGIIVTKEKKKHGDENHTYEMYYEYHEKVSQIVSHRILAINRAEKEKVVSVKIEVDKDFLISYIYRGLTRNRESNTASYLQEAVKDSLNRLLLPSIEREVRHELTQKANEQALTVFSINLEKLLMQAPIKDKVVLGVDPAYRTGCKLAVVDGTGRVLKISKAFFTLSHHDKDKAKAELLNLIKEYQVQIIAIGNGTASRESEAFIAEIIKENNLATEYAIVSEAGASVYSASKIAQDEFPSFQVEERSAVSIARRLQDPLAELVKIEPKAISVGQYQHDIPPKQLSDQLDFVVEKTVNSVGVDVNTASVSLLSYIAGLNKTVAKNIIKYRDEHGGFRSRNDLLQVRGMGAKSFEQAIGFLRIIDGDNPLDATDIHPENYSKSRLLLENLDFGLKDLGSKELIEKINTFDLQEYPEILALDRYTFDDIIASFKKPNRSPRDHYQVPLLKKDILTIDNLQPGMVLEGTVRNVVDFGAFVDIGLKNDGLIHISKMAKRRIKHPLEVLNIGDIIRVKVIDVDLKRKRVGLSLVQN